MRARRIAIWLSALLLATGCGKAVPQAPAPPAAPQTAAPLLPDDPSLPWRTQPSQTGRFTDPIHASIVRHEPLRFAAPVFVSRDQAWAAVDTHIYRTRDGARHWDLVTTLPASIQALAFISATEGWAATKQGVLHTTDGGHSWAPVHPDIGQGTVYSLRFEHFPVGVLTADFGIYLTADGGQSWREVTTPCQHRWPGSASFVNAETGWVLCTGAPGTGMQSKSVYRTHDGGTTWELLAEAQHGTPPVNNGLYLGGYANGLFFLNAQHGWITEARGGLVQTADGGHTWTTVDIGRSGEQFLGPVQFLSPRQGFLVAHDGGVPVLMATVDGIHWEQRWPDLAPERESPLQLFSATEAIAAGSFMAPGALLRTADGGQTWQLITTLPVDRVTALAFTGRQEGRAIGETWHGGNTTNLLYATHDGGQTWELLGPADDQARASFGSAGPPRQLPPPRCDLHSNPAVVAGVVWGVGTCGVDAKSYTLLRTTDGGQHWTPYDLGDLRPSRIAAVDADTAWLIDELGHFYTTTDGGAHWQQVR